MDNTRFRPANSQDILPYEIVCDRFGLKDHIKVNSVSNLRDDTRNTCDHSRGKGK